MKRIDGIWPVVVSFENLLRAHRRARRGKRTRADVATFGLDLEREILTLQRELVGGEYRPSPYRLFTIYDRKPRLIAAARFRDRVVHHAIMNVVEPFIDRSFIYDSYASRRGKGVHLAVDRYQRWARRYAHVLKMDVQQYFPSIDHDRLREKLRRRIKDPAVLQLLDVIIAGSPIAQGSLRYAPGDDLFTPLSRRVGIPIGNVTSQFFANLYLDDLDHHLKERLQLPAYLRYVDDLVVVDDDKARLADVREVVRESLERDRLRLHPRKAHVSPVGCGLNLLGYLVFPDRRRLRSDNGHRFRRRLRTLARLYRDGRVAWADVMASVQSWIGHAQHADTTALRAAMFSEIAFVRGTGRRAGCG